MVRAMAAGAEVVGLDPTDDPEVREALHRAWLEASEHHLHLSECFGELEVTHPLEGRDQAACPTSVNALRAALASRPDCEVVVYPDAPHAFIHGPSWSVHRPGQAAAAWHRILTFLEPLRERGEQERQ